MSQAKLTLRPPPNIDFVQGYPGIPPGAPDRPQAAVKGAIEVRVGPGGVKAKWVRVELRKVETLPGGGLANTFFDFVGQSPINLWQANGEYAPLQTQDFPFYIRIPESIPPSIALEKGAGIKYELIATLCIKGKRGFLRRDKHVILSTSAPIVIDKHELHSTWPVYTQAESRSNKQDGVTLTVDRNHTCYGPGDRISVSATVKSEVMHTVILRGFEFLLRETTVFRAGGNVSGKKGAPQVKTGVVSEQKVPVNATLYGGAMHKAELNVTIPTHHTSTSLNAARHIDITYVLTVRALLSTGKPIIMDLPVVISNWPKSVSIEAVRRIGLASNVASHTHHGQPAVRQIADQSGMTVAPSQPITATLPTSPPPRQNSTPHPYLNPAPPPTSVITDSSDGATDIVRSPGNYNTIPAGSSAGFSRATDEFGVSRIRGPSMDQNGPQVQTIGGTQVVAPTRPFVEGATPRPRSNSGRPGAPAANRLTVTNFADDMPEEVRAQNIAQLAARQHTRNASFGARSGTTARSQGWMPAEEEKRRLYETAMAKVEVAHQGNIPRAISPPLEIQSPTPVRNNSSPMPNANGSTSGGVSKSGFMSAEEEKARLFQQAQDAVRRTQGPNATAAPTTPSPAHSRSGSVNAQPGMSPGAALYSQALSSMQRNTSTGPAVASSSAASPPAPATSTPGASPSSTTAKRPNPHYMSADEEKAALRRYYDAKAAVDRMQGSAYDSIPEKPESLRSPGSPAPTFKLAPVHAPVPSSAPVAYDTLYPNSNPPNTVMSPPPPAPGELPPAFTPGPTGQPSYISEKEKLRRAYEARDSAALAAQQQHQQQSPPPIDATPPGYYAVSSPAQYAPQPNGIKGASAEKEMLRRRFEQQDSAATTNGQPPTTPPRSEGGRALPTPRAQPTPPGSANGTRPLTAAEEKARLKAMYDAEERAPGSPLPVSSPMSMPLPMSPPYTNGLNGAGVYRQSSTAAVPSYNSIPPPPPLMPRPPKEYIQETQQEDEKIAAHLEAMDNDVDDDELEYSPKSVQDLRPFSAFHDGLDLANGSSSATSRPPLPPKVALDDP